VYFSLGALAPESMPPNMLQVRPEEAALPEAQIAGRRKPEPASPVEEDTDEHKR